MHKESLSFVNAAFDVQEVLCESDVLAARQRLSERQLWHPGELSGKGVAFSLGLGTIRALSEVNIPRLYPCKPLHACA